MQTNASGLKTQQRQQNRKKPSMSYFAQWSGEPLSRDSGSHLSFQKNSMRIQREVDVTNSTLLLAKRRGTMPDFRHLARLGYLRNSSTDSFTALLKDIRSRSVRSHSLDGGQVGKYVRMFTQTTRNSNSSTRSGSVGSELPELVDRVSSPWPLFTKDIWNNNVTKTIVAQ